MKVIVGDDEPRVLSIVKSLLDYHGCIVISADKGQEALEIIEWHKAGLVLLMLDIKMPDMTGNKVLLDFKKLSRTSMF